MRCEQAAEAARRESELVLQGLADREATAKQRLSAFGKTLGGFSAKLTRTPLGLRRVRTGYVYQPPA